MDEELIENTNWEALETKGCDYSIDNKLCKWWNSAENERKDDFTH